MFDINDPSLGSNARHVLRQYAEENTLARSRGENAAGTEEFGSGCLRGSYNNLREIIQNNPSLIVVPSIINAGSLFVQRPICRTNYLPNNSMAGAIGSVLPTNWSIGSLPSGITVSYSASGTAVAADGTSVNYIDVTVSGTAGTSGFLNIRPTPSSSTIAAFVGQSWNTSVYLQLINGSVTSASPTWQLQELNSSQGFLQGSNVSGLSSLTVGGPFERYNISRVLTESATALVTCRWGHSLTSGIAYNYTIRIGSPQLERFSVPTPMIATSTGAVTRLNESTNVVGLPPDFTVSRNTGATRVGPNGLIEAGNTNLAFHSESWSTASNWNFNGVTRATGSTSAFLTPDNTLTANAISPTSGNVSHSLFSNSPTTITYVSGTIYTQSAFIKAGTGAAGRYAQLTFSSTRFSQAGFANFDLQNGTVTLVSGTSADTNRNARIENYGNGWYRCSFTATATGNGADAGFVFVLITASGDSRVPQFAGTITDVIYGWGAQVEAGSTASEYIPTTTVARTRFAGVTVDGTIAANIPRIDWLGQSCPGLLVEPSGQNLCLQSAGFQDLAVWSRVNIAVTTGSTAAFTAPDNSTDADLLTATSSGSARIVQSFSFVSGTTYTYSTFAKAGSGFFGLTMENGGVSSGAAVIWNLNTGALAVSGVVGSGYTLVSQGIENYGNGWYRCRMTVLMSVSVAGNIRANTSNGTMSTAVIQSDNGNSVYVWGAQVETGSVATTYIPTTASAVSRAAETISVSGVSGLIGQTEGTIYIECESNDGADDVFFINRSVVNGIALYKNASNSYFGRIHYSSNFITFQSASGITGMVKIAIAYKSGDSTMYLNGSRVGAISTTAFTFGAALNTVGVNKEPFFSGARPSRIRAAALYTTRLSDEQLQHLTNFYEPEYDNINLWNAFTQRYSNPDPCLYNRLCALLY